MNLDSSVHVQDGLDLGGWRFAFVVSHHAGLVGGQKPAELPYRTYSNPQEGEQVGKDVHQHQDDQDDEDVEVEVNVGDEASEIHLKHFTISIRFF
jgi:hypothetical protein